MKLRSASISRSASRRGFSLLECLVYVGALSVVLGVGLMALFKSWDAHRDMRRNADDIVQALHAGERWRADIRTATDPIRVEHPAEQVTLLHIPIRHGEILYDLQDGELHRQAGRAAPRVRVLARIKDSQMQADPRPGVAAWRWELELQPGKAKTKMRPRFTFEAAAGTTGQP